MERAARLLQKIKLSADGLVNDEVARAIWPVAIGKRLAGRTGPVTMFRATMVVDVEDAIWQKQLTALKDQILGRLMQLLGPGVVTDLHFRVGVQRRQPQRAETAEQLPDYADGIKDPIFRQLYLASRKRANS
jgi:hypothetical protein